MTVIIGTDLIFGTLLTLKFVPAFYAVFFRVKPAD
jgi:multidrug efflux pump subunit AcrB